MVTDRRGQALMELVVGLFSLALVVSALCAFAHYIARSLEAQNELRTSGGSNVKTDSFSLDSLSADYVFGQKTLKIKETVSLPSTILTP